jgi:hypothetical protein
MGEAGEYDRWKRVNRSNSKHFSLDIDIPPGLNYISLFGSLLLAPANGLA